MVKVTEKDYYLDGYMEEINIAIANRVKKRKQDIVIIYDGKEGSGKTNASIAQAYHLGVLTGRKFDNDNIFFDLNDMIKFAGHTEEQIILWDEAALGGLAADWTNFAQRKLKSMLMVCRKKRHIFIFNVPRFFRLSPGIIERAYCLFHIYENDKEEPGNFMFIGADYLEGLYLFWKSKKFANYWKFKKFHGCFTWVLPKLIDEEKYEAEKDAAILKLADSEQEDKTRMASTMLRKGISWRFEDFCKKYGIKVTQDEKSSIIGVGKHAYSNYLRDKPK